MPTVISGSRGASARTRSDAGCARSSIRCARPGRASSCGRWPRDRRARAQVGHGVPHQAVERSGPPAEGSRCPALIYNDLDLLLRTVRDLFTADVAKLIIDSRAEYDRRARVHRRADAPLGLIEPTTRGTTPIFDGIGIEIEIDRALERKVWLQVGRLPRSSTDRGADRHRRQHRALRRQEEPGRHDPPDQPGGRQARSPSSSASATSAASSSSTSSTWSEAANREKRLRGAERGPAQGQGAQRTSCASRSSAWSR